MPRLNRIQLEKENQRLRDENARLDQYRRLWFGENLVKIVARLYRAFKSLQDYRSLPQWYRLPEQTRKDMLAAAVIVGDELNELLKKMGASDASKALWPDENDP